MPGAISISDKPYQIEFHFAYRRDLVEAVKMIPDRRYDRDQKIWFLPATPGHARAAIDFALKHDFRYDPPLVELSKQAGAPVTVSAIGRTVEVVGDLAIVRFPYGEMLVSEMRRVTGANWDKATSTWNVPLKPESLIRLAEFAKQNDFTGDIERIRDLADKVAVLSAEAIEASKAADADFDVEGFGKTLRPFQRAGVKYASEKKRSIIGDEMGLGKTVEALATIQYLNAYPAVITCPANLILNWLREVRDCLPGRSIQILGKETAGRSNSDVTIINYDQLKNYREFLVRREFRALIADESHLLKNGKTQRAQIVEEIAVGSLFARNDKNRADRRSREKLRAPCEVRLLLTGTPVVNRPDELTSQLQILDRLKEFGGWYRFANDYCGLTFGRFGADTSGAKNLKELHDRLRATCYVRRLKSEVLKELPPKQRTVVPTDITNRREYQKAEAELIEWLRANHGHAKADAAERAEQLVRIEVLKQLSARGKMAAILEWINDFLDTGEKLVIFAWHKEIVIELANALKCDAIYGDGKSAQTRQDKVDRFQNDPSVRCIVLNVQSGGVGITLTAASNVVFCELGWNPATMDQAGDRCHRIGQTDSVTEWWFVGSGTIDVWIQELIEAKRAVVNAAVDGSDEVQEVSVLNELVARLISDDKPEKSVNQVRDINSDLSLF